MWVGMRVRVKERVGSKGEGWRDEGRIDPFLLFHFSQGRERVGQGI